MPISTITASSVADNSLTTDQFVSTAVHGRRNLIINGAMQVAQRGTSFTGVGNGAGTYPVDRWQYNQSADSAFTLEQVSDAPADFSNSAKFTVTTPDTSITSAQYSQCVHKIEGQNINHLNWGSSDAKTVTFSCWVKSSVTGQYPARFINSAGTKSYAFYITINSANTWEYKTHTLVGPTDGTFLTNNGEGFTISLGFGIGSNYTGATANQWQTVSSYLASNLTNTTGFIATTNATFQITGVQLEVGSQATPFEHRSYGEELSLCQRYYLRKDFEDNSDGVFGAMAQWSTVSAYGVYQFPVKMRDQPAGGGSALSTFVLYANAQTRTLTVFVNATRKSADAAEFHVDWASALTVAGGAWLRSTGNAYLYWDAEL